MEHFVIIQCAVPPKIQKTACNKTATPCVICLSKWKTASFTPHSFLKKKVQDLKMNNQEISYLC